jgi:hypothetical protein
MARRRNFASISTLLSSTDASPLLLSGLADPEWGLSPDYDFPTIIREAVEEHLERRRAAPRDTARTPAP